MEIITPGKSLIDRLVMYARELVQCGSSNGLSPLRCHEIFTKVFTVNVTWWRHRMGTYSALLALCVRNWPVTVEFPSQRPVTPNFGVFFDQRLNQQFGNKGDACDLRHHCAHYDVILMQWCLDASRTNYKAMHQCSKVLAMYCWI